MPRSLLRKLFTEMLQVLWWQKVKLYTYAVGFSCTAFEVLLCAILLSRVLTTIFLPCIFYIELNMYSVKNESFMKCFS